MSTNINFFMSKEIMEENGPRPQQSSQIIHQIKVEDHDIGQSPNLRRETDSVQGRLLELTSKNLHKRLKLIFPLIIL